MGRTATAQGSQNLVRVKWRITRKEDPKSGRGKREGLQTGKYRQRLCPGCWGVIASCENG